MKLGYDRTKEMFPLDLCLLIPTPDKEQYYPLVDVNWWSDGVLILARCSGSVTVSSVRTLRNLLGKSCEWFEPSPRVAAAHDGGFLSLEVRPMKAERMRFEKI